MTDTPPEHTPLTQPTDGIPPVVQDPVAVHRLAAAMAQCHSPVAIDAERASGFRYSPRAYLVQLRRADIGTQLIDPVALGNLSVLAKPLSQAQWVLHAAIGDLPCLIEAGLAPRQLFDTELAARLAGFPRVGLATMVAEFFGYQLAKEHSAADWSRRPLPDTWLTYAALDVELLLPLRDRLETILQEQGKLEWATQEFAHLVARAHDPVPPRDLWRRVSGLHQIKQRRGLAIVRELVAARDVIARQRDIDVHRVLPAAAIITLAQNPPPNSNALGQLPYFRTARQRALAHWWQQAIDRALTLPESELPLRREPDDGPPPAQLWRRWNPAAANRLAAARAALAVLSAQVSVPVENLLSPAILRRLLWAAVPSDLPAALAATDARPWQIALTAPVIDQAIRDQ